MRLLKELLTSTWVLCPLLTLLLLVGSLLDHPLLRQLELPLYDQLVTLRNTSVNPEVVLLAIDQKSRAVLADDPASIATQSRILQKLAAFNVKQVAILTPLSQTAAAVPIQQISSALKTFQPFLAVEPIYSKDLENRAMNSGLLPMPAALQAPQELLLTLQNPLASQRYDHTAAETFLPPGESLQHPRLELGHLIFHNDRDGRIRRHPLLIESQGQLFPSLPLQLVLLAKNSSLAALQVPPRDLPGHLKAGSWQYPVDNDYQMLLDLSGRKRPYLQYSVSQLLAGELDTRKLSEKLILIGTTESYSDRHQLATRGELSSSELAAYATATLLTDRPLQRPFWGWLVEGLVLVYFAGLLLLLLPRLSARAGLASLCFFLTVWLLATATCLFFFGFWLQFMPALLLCLCGYILVRWKVGQRLVENSQLENKRQLALSLQEQGFLDQALDKFLQFAPRDKASKEMLYNLGLDFERKRMPHKALTAYRHLLTGGRFRDTREKLQQLQSDDPSTNRSQRTDATLVLDRPGEKPTLGRYRIERALGQGAMGTVYQGIDPKINRQVAIKTLAYQQIDPDQLATVKERFFREAEAAGRLNHPLIVTIYDVGEENDLAYLAMELLDGKELSHYCQVRQRLPVARIVHLVAQVARALDYAHRQGVVHRDIKPANILVVKDWQIKVADFGVARVVSSSQTETGIILGTPSYMSPEQVAGKKVDGRSDLFSLGVVMYELLSSEKPFQGDSMAALMYNISNCNYRPIDELCPELPENCSAILDKLLRKSTSRRFKNAALLAEELEILGQELELE